MSSNSAPLCQHIKLNGSRCGSPALRDQECCYFHTCCYPIKIDVSTSAQYPASPFFLHPLEDASSIQYAINQICQHTLHRRLDLKKASVLLYAMQVAMSNLDRLNANKNEHKNQKTIERKSQQNDPLPRPPVKQPLDGESPVGDEDDALPPGTIQACEQRQFAV